MEKNWNRIRQISLEGIARTNKILANENPSDEDLAEAGVDPRFFDRARINIAQEQAKSATKH